MLGDSEILPPSAEDGDDGESVMNGSGSAISSAMSIVPYPVCTLADSSHPENLVRLVYVHAAVYILSYESLLQFVLRIMSTVSE